MPNPLAAGHAKKKKSDYDGKATAAQPGSALTKIAGGHLGEPPTSGAAAVTLVYCFPRGPPRRVPLLKPVGHQNPVKHRCPNKTLVAVRGGQATLTI